jgi:hypothetical protein
VSIGAVDPGDARERARDIVDGFRPKDPPRPFRGVLDWIGARLAEIGRVLGAPFAWILETFGDGFGWLIIAAAAAGVIVAVVSAVRGGSFGRVGRARSSPPPDETQRRSRPEDLEAAAAAAAARGEFDLAVRLRFRAGLQRLDRDAGAIVYSSSIGTGDVRRSVELPMFDRLADRFERVTYGPDVAASEDDDEARREWPRVVDAARR